MQKRMGRAPKDEAAVLAGVILADFFSYSKLFIAMLVKPYMEFWTFALSFRRHIPFLNRFYVNVRFTLRTLDQGFTSR